MSAQGLSTDRLRLRRWRESDRAPFASINADPQVMEHYPAPLSRAESDAFIDRIEETFATRSLGLWAVEERESTEFIGYVGLWPAEFDAPFTPAVEIGWRLARAHWGRGLATEAARVALEDGFVRLELDEVVSFTSTANLRSRSVMRKLGLSHTTSDDFEHPALDLGHPLRPHVLYRQPRLDWVCRQDERLRPATLSDRPFLDRLRREVYADLIEATFGEWVEERHLRYESTCFERGAISIIEMKGEPIGMIQLAPHPKGIEVCEIQIRNAMQRSGLGTALLRGVQAHAEHGSQAVALDVPKKNDRAKRLYERLGFAQVGSNESHHLMLWKPPSR